MVSAMTVLVPDVWLKTSEGASHRDQWLCEETILRRVRLRLPTTINLTRREITVALQSVAGSHESTNILGLYHVEFRPICPYNSSKTPRHVHYFYRHVSTKPSFPRVPSDVEDIIARSVRLVEEREILSRLLDKNTNNDEGEKQMSTNPERINTESLIPGTTIQESVLPETTNPSVSPETVIPVTTSPETGMKLGKFLHT